MNSQLSKKLQRTLVVFPAIAMVVSVGCVSASSAHTDVSPIAKKAPSTVNEKGSAAWPTALSVLARLKVATPIATGTKDKRARFRHWSDLDKDGCDTRNEVLIAESSTPAQIDATKCKVVEGDWISLFDGVRHTNDSNLEIDHMVPLAEAWDSGAASWNAAKREKFANDLDDPRSLIAVTAEMNSKKGSREPHRWLPPSKSYRCTYLSDWVAIKNKWKLSVDVVERNAIRKLLTTSCKTTTVAPWGSKQTASTTTTIPSKGSSGARTALSVLASIPQAKEEQTGYQRSLFKHWSDLDGDGCSTREEVLIAESLTKAQVDAYGCKVIAGDWYSPYDNRRYEYPSDIDIDHVVALKEAWDSGAHSWSASKREQFANDLSDERSLIAVKDSENQSKSDKDPSNWLPKNSAYLCTYLANWVAVKAQWGLSMDTSEWGRIKNLLTSSCATTTIAPWGSGKSTGAASTGGSSSAPVGTTAPVASPAPAVPQSTVAQQPSGGSGTIPTITPGAYCAPEGAKGTFNAKSYVCATTNASGVPYSNGRARWRQG